MAAVVFEDTRHPIPHQGVCSFPALDTREAEGRLHPCAAWSSYRPEAEGLRARVDDEAPLQLCSARAVSPPSVAARSDGRFEVAAVLVDSQVPRLRRFLVEADGHGAVDLPCPAPASAALPEGVRLVRGRDRSYLAVREGRTTGGSIVVYECTDRDCRELLCSPPELDAYRPALCVPAAQPLVVYDAWDGSSYHVFAQTSAGVRRLSSGDGRHLLADVAAETADTAWACWVGTVDVVSSLGVVDARCRIQLARIRSEGVPEVFETREDVEDLSHGLLDTDPDPRGVWGYLGRRRHPWVVRTGSTMRLLWEQKEQHEGSTRTNTGVLWQRAIGGEGASDAESSPWSKGAVWYEPPGCRSVAGPDRIPVVCIEGMYTDEREVGVRTAAPTKAPARLPGTSWQGWSPVTLPLPESVVADRPSIEIGGRTYRLYWLDLHCHTALSADAEGEPDECIRTGRYKAGLDGLLATDNDHYVIPMTRWEWLRACEAAGEHTVPGEFVALHGYEWTSRPVVEGEQIIDHRSVLLPEATEDILRWNEVDGDIHALYDFVRSHGGLVHAHHQDWRLVGDPVEANIEACSSWRAYLEADPGPYHRALARGWKIGLIGGSDEHRRNPGLGGALTGLWAQELTPRGVLEALRAHRCYATSGRRVVLDFRIDGVPMGGTVPAGSGALTVRARSPVRIESVQLWGNGEVVRTWSVGRCEVDLRHTVHCSGGLRWLYLKLILEGDPLPELPANLQPLYGTRVWSSPIWVEGAAR